MVKRYLIVLSLLLGMLPLQRAVASEDAREVHTATARPGVVRQTITVPGVIAADPAGLTPLAAPHAGQVFRILVRPGDTVAAGAPLLTIVPTLAEQQSYAMAQTQAALARRDLVQAQARRAAGQASPAELFSAERNFQVAEDALLAGERRFALGNGEETLLAPFAARIETIPVRQGNSLFRGSTMMLLAPQSALIALFDVPPEQIRRVHSGALAIVFPVAQGGNRVTTHVEAPGALLDLPMQPGRIAIHLRDAQAYGFSIGGRVAASIAVDERKGLVVPYGAVARDARGEHVFRLEGERARRVGVRTGLSDGVQTVIELGLAAGDTIIVPGAAPVKDGMVVHDAGQLPGLR